MKKLQKLFAILLAICMMMSLLSVNAFADEVNDGGESPAEEEPVAGPVYRCQKDEHPHRDGCYQENWTCQLHVHETACYDAEQNLICAKEASRDLICDAEEHVHTPDCYHVHGITCYPLECDEKYDCDKQYDCDKLYDCESSEEGHMCSDATCAKHVCLSDSCTAHVCGDSCKDHAHVDGCYDTAADRVCGKNEVEPYCEKVEYTHGEGCYKLHEHVLGTAEESGCYQLLLTCDKEEHTHSNACIPPSGENRANGGYYTNPINENIDVTLYNYGSYINVDSAEFPKALMFGYHNNHSNGGRVYEGIDGPARGVSGNIMTSWNDILYYSGLIQNVPTVERKLNAAGYPQTAAQQGYWYNRRCASLEYLFPKGGSALRAGDAGTLTDYSKMREYASFSETNGYNSNYESMRFEMVGDGGLFEKDRNGYYTYDSAYTSAYFDQANGQFLLSNTIIGPSHEGIKFYNPSTVNYAQNFLPFNKINFENKDQFYQLNDQWVYMTDYAVANESARQDLADLWFGFDMEFDFFIPKDGKVNGEEMVFYFNGDDDIWVYIDDVLILDIAGNHGPRESWINFATGEVFNENYGYSCGNSRKQMTTIKAQFEGALGADYVAEHMRDQFTKKGAFVDYSKHTLKFFYTERGGNISYCALKFNMPALPTGSLSVGKAVEDMDGKAPAFITDALSYEFRVLKADADGNATNELFIPVGTEFDIVAQDDYKNVLGTGVVGEDGYFLLKDGQVALFENAFEYANKTPNVTYVVEERMPEEFSGVYEEVEYLAVTQGVSNAVRSGDGAEKSYVSYYTPALASDETQKVTFTNKVKVELNKPEKPGEEGEDNVVDPMIATLSITKQEAGDQAPARQETYQIRVLAGYSEETMQPLSKGAKYTVGESEKTVKDGGIIELKADETAKLVFLEGTSYKVEEIVDSRYTYNPSYENAEGMIAIEETPDVVEVFVVNTYYVPDGDEPGGNEGGEGGSTVEPGNPGTPSNPGAPSTPSNPGAPSTPSTPDDTTIEDEDVPMTDLPIEDAEISDEDVPLAVLPEEEVPLVVLPATSDATLIWMALSALSGAGLFLTGKKREEE